MKDNIFGELEYKYNFFKYEKVEFFGKEYKLKVVVESYDKTISDKQRKNYQTFSKYLEENEDTIKNLIKQYFLDIYEKEIDIKNDITPTTLYFAKDGSWGILFETVIDEENGFAIFIQDDKFEVGTQDMFI